MNPFVRLFWEKADAIRGGKDCRVYACVMKEPYIVINSIGRFL